MCVIVDINVAPQVLLAPDDPDFGEVNRRLFAQKAPNLMLIYGGHLATEYERNTEVMLAIQQLDSAGRAVRVDGARIESEAKRLEEMSVCRSNDRHILALARVGGARILCSRDRALHADFKNKRILDSPRGNVYQSAMHKRLLRKPCKS